RRSASRRRPNSNTKLATNTYTVGLNHPVRLQLRQLLGVEPAHLAENLGVVLAQQWSARHLRRRRREPDRAGRRRHAPTRRMLDDADESLPHLRIGHVDEDVVVRTEGTAAIEIRGRGVR